MLRAANFRNAVLVIAGFALPLITLHPLQNVPFLDDWTYAWSVESLLNTGTLKILDWSTHINVAHIIWGTLFCLPTGFSFTALRLSTWVLSIFGLIGFYLLLLQLGVSRRDSVIGAAALGFSPMYFLLSFSFMTDIPALAFTTWSVLCFLKWLSSARHHWLFAAAVFSILTIGTRLPGLAIPFAMTAFLLLRENVRLRKFSAVFVVGVLPVLFAIALVYWHSHHIEHRTDLLWIQGSPQNRLSKLRYGFTMFPQWLLITVVYAVAPLGVLLTPVAVSGLKGLYYRKVVLGWMVVIALVALGFLTGVTSPSEHGANWYLTGIDTTYRMVLKGADAYVPSGGWNQLAGAVGTLLFCLAVGPALTAGQGERVAVLRWLFLMESLLTVVLSLWYPRYLLALLPALLALVLAAAPIGRPRLAVALIALSAVVSVGVLHDELAYNRALWLSVDYLRQIDAPLPRIHGGYVVNGWLQYAHKENARINGEGDVEVEMINVNTQDFDYGVFNEAAAGWITLKEFPYTAWLGRSGRLYVLQRSGG